MERATVRYGYRILCPTTIRLSILSYTMLNNAFISKIMESLKRQHVSAKYALRHLPPPPPIPCNSECMQS